MRAERRENPRDASSLTLRRKPDACRGNMGGSVRRVSPGRESIPKMRYQTLYAELKNAMNYDADRIALGLGMRMRVRNFDFESRLRHEFPENVKVDGILAAVPEVSDREKEDIRNLIGVSDADIGENLRFRYHMIIPDDRAQARNVIIMFHGFNEKLWHKYLPWATHLAARTGYAVLLFPLAFHMNRAPKSWSDVRATSRVSKIRRGLHGSVIDSTLSNVAISTRLHYRPERFIWSGLESYYDVMDLVDSIRAGGHPAIEAEADIHFFSYSVGSFLGQTIMMTNKDGNFSQSKYAMFCGGPVFNRLSPVSRFILDSEASVRLYSYLVEHLESHMRDNRELREVLDGDVEEGRNFRALLSYRSNLEYRENKLREVADRLYAVALAKDEVVPPYEVVNTLRGSRQDIDIPVDVLDLPYAYRHEDPFPANGRQAYEVDTAFRTVFDRIAGFLTAPSTLTVY